MIQNVSTGLPRTGQREENGDFEIDGVFVLECKTVQENDTTPRKDSALTKKVKRFAPKTGLLFVLA